MAGHLPGRWASQPRREQARETGRTAREQEGDGMKEKLKRGQHVRFTRHFRFIDPPDRTYIGTVTAAGSAKPRLAGKVRISYRPGVSGENTSAWIPREDVTPTDELPPELVDLIEHLKRIIPLEERRAMVRRWKAGSDG